MSWLKKHYHRYMIRPIVTKTITRTMIGLVVVLLWDTYANVERTGISRLEFGMGAVGIMLMAGAWFCYLHLDGVKPIETAKKRLGKHEKKTEKIKKQTTADMIDYIEENVEEAFEEEDKVLCQLAAFFLAGLLLILGSILIGMAA